MLLTIGHLSMNRFWGENERRRGPLCTSALIRTADGLLLVDPSRPPEEMPALLNDQAGVRAEEIRHVFLTHFHGDHRFGLEAFPNAEWWMAEEETAFWRGRCKPEEERLLDRLRPPDHEVVRGIGTLHLPGHTPGLTGLAWEWRSQRVVLAADAAMTEAFFWAREGYHNSTDLEQARATIDRLAAEADLVIPGHGNAFFPRLRPESDDWWSGGVPDR